jgi:hypothetical protein
MFLPFFLFFCGDVSAQRSKIATPASLETIRSFLHYHLYHETFYQLLHQQETCRLNDDSNETLKYINNKVISCSNPDFFPRILNAPQVTFKKADPESKSQKSDSDHPSSAPSSSPKKSAKKHRKSSLVNQSLQSHDQVSSLNFSKTPDTTEASDADDDDKTIHKYLLFALVLPKHPFSRELVEALQIISPMFPSVTFYFGIGYEFEELCAQYDVKSFPKLLFVRNGILVKRYEDSRDPVTLAIQIARWVGKFPETIPVPVSAVTNKRTRLATFYNYKSTWFTVPKGDSLWAKFLQSLDSLLVALSAGRSVEPLVSCSPQVTQWDFEIFLLSLLYTLIRSWSWLYPLWIRRITQIRHRAEVEATLPLDQARAAAPQAGIESVSATQPTEPEILREPTTSIETETSLPEIENSLAETEPAIPLREMVETEEKADTADRAEVDGADRDRDREEADREEAVEAETDREEAGQVVDENRDLE